MNIWWRSPILQWLLSALLVPTAKTIWGKLGPEIQVKVTTFVLRHFFSRRTLHIALAVIGTAIVAIGFGVYHGFLEVIYAMHASWNDTSNFSSFGKTAWKLYGGLALVEVSILVSRIKNHRLGYVLSALAAAIAIMALAIVASTVVDNKAESGIYGLYGERFLFITFSPLVLLAGLFEAISLLVKTNREIPPPPAQAIEGVA